MAEADVTATIVAGSAGTDNAGGGHTQADATAGGAAGNGDWKKDIPEDIRTTIDKYASPSDLAKGYSELMKKLGATVQIPAVNASAEERNAFLTKLGRPESPDGYDLSSVTMPEGLDPSKEGEKAFRTKMHELGLTKEQTKGLHEWSMTRYTDSVIASRATAKKAQEDAASALRTAWGIAYDANQAQVDKIIRLGGDKFVSKLNSGPGKDPEIRQGLYEISKLFADETLVTGRAPGGKLAESKAGFVVDFTKSPELAPRTG